MPLPQLLEALEFESPRHRQVVEKSIVRNQLEEPLRKILEYLRQSFGEAVKISLGAEVEAVFDDHGDPEIFEMFSVTVDLEDDNVFDGASDAAAQAWCAQHSLKQEALWAAVETLVGADMSTKIFVGLK